MIALMSVEIEPLARAINTRISSISPSRPANSGGRRPADGVYGFVTTSMVENCKVLL
jgi:hypothetical protein